MSNDRLSLLSTFSVNNEFSEDDARFLHVTVDVLHTGENLNKSFFSKEVVDECVESIKNVPILGFIKRDKHTNEDDFAGHEYILKRTENGVEEKYAGRCYGVVPESCNPRWTTKVCDDGQEREFLQVDAIMWEKFTDATSIIHRDSEKGQSMELEVASIEGENDDNGVFHFTKFRFEGLCVLGDNAQPAMVNANVKINDGVNFSMNDFMSCVQRELNDKFELFNKAFAKLTSCDDNSGQGGVNDMTKENTDFSQTVLQQFEDIAAIVEQYETRKNYWGNDVPRFYLADIQDNEVITVDTGENYHYYGFPFSINGDKPEIDFASGGQRKKLRYENYEDGASVTEGAFDFGKYIENVEATAFAKVDEAEKSKSEVETEFAEVKANYDEIKPKYDEYVQAEAQREADELNAQKDAKFAEYEDILGENADFTALKEKKADMSVDEIEKECAVMFVKASRANKINFSKDDSASAVIGVFDDNDGVDDGYIHTKYGNIRRV